VRFSTIQGDIAPKIMSKDGYMKAFARYRYGSTKQLKIVTLPIPTPRSNEVCIKICATSLNASDWEFLTGRPAYTRFWGLRKPKITILGSDISGTLMSVGSGVSEFKPGDAVFGDIMEYWGGFGEYAVAPASMLMTKPKWISHQQAACLPQSSCVAWQALEKIGPLYAGSSILINGAGGGAGSFAIQLAKRLGAKVTAVDSVNKFSHMRQMGADRVIDYRQTDYCREQHQYDGILDFVASHTVFDNSHVLKPRGKYYVVGGRVSNILKTLVFGTLMTFIGKKKVRVLAAQPNKHLEDIIIRVEHKDIIIPIDRQFGFKDIPQAMQYLGEGQARGKVVINFENQNI